MVGRLSGFAGVERVMAAAGGGTQGYIEKTRWA